MIQEVNDYIDDLGGDLSTDFQYFRDVTELFYLDPKATGAYSRVAESSGSTYQAVQRGACRAAERLWNSGGQMLRKDLQRPLMAYPGPLSLSRWIARIVTKKSEPK